MCQSGYAIENIGESKEGDVIYYVTLRARTQEDNCTCQVFVENQSQVNLQTTIKPYMTLNSTSASPKGEACGLELNLVLYQMNNIQTNMDNIGCTSGPRSLSFPKNGVLRFTSKVIGGNLTRGYCIDVQRGHVVGQNNTLKIVCGDPGVTPSLQMTTTQSPDHFTGHPTATDSTIKDHPTSPGSLMNNTDNSTIYIVAGISAGVLLILTLVIVIIFCKRKSLNKTRKTQETSRPDIAFTNEQDDPNYDGLKYNVLYVSAEYADKFGGDNSSVDNENSHINHTVTEHDVNYSTVGDNVPRAPSITEPPNGNPKNLDLGPGYENNKGTEVSQFDYFIPKGGNCNVYAVVDKKRVMADSKSKPDDSSHTYAVVSSGMFPHVQAVEPNVRKQILEGKYINLATLLNNQENVQDYKTVDESDGSVLLIKHRDPRLQRNLSIQEFLEAFNIYKNIICEKQDRRIEFDMYIQDVIDISARYKGTVFYEYHKAFANKVAAIKLTHGKVVDWSIRDEKLYSSITSGQIIKECETCGSLGHLTAVCQTLPSFGQSNNRSKPTYNQTHFQKSQIGSNGRDDSNTDIRGRPVLFFRGREVCNNFLSGKCFKGTNCLFAHVITRSSSGATPNSRPSQEQAQAKN
ncbi:unnamed protein product [Mytilus coruscus]|uniref:C3H1-type domain-containing protein n=1 Tax=Mytilus coruscus TaxID=42192 RepID=A0A6J8EEH7_MYTCO|nr:unnamed protein product [Mytilus coruscus]